jgi:hypothetical protein
MISRKSFAALIAEGSGVKDTRKSLVMVFLLAFLFSSCGPASVATKIVPANINTPADVPEPSPTSTLSQVDKIFAIRTSPAYLVDTPTPLATPGPGYSSVRLRNLSEEDALELIHGMDENSFQNFSPAFDWLTEDRFVSSQGPVATAIEEYLYRYPDSLSADRLRWQLAFINAITYGGLPGNQYGDAWMVAELQKRLDRGDALPGHLETILHQYWFDSVYSQPIQDLFGDGRVGWLYQIVPRVWADDYFSGRGGLFIVVREIDHDSFEIFTLNSAWNFSFGESSVFGVGDHNQNGVPEIALYIGGHSGTTCGGHLLIYEWKSAAFAELTHDALALHDCTEGFEFSELNAVPAIIFSGIFPLRKELYLWNGTDYAFSRYLDATPLETWQDSVGTGRLSYSDESELLKTILASGEATEFGPAYSDYLRYRLGTVYALHSERQEAIHEFQGLISSPVDTTRRLFPDMAKRFLELYTGDAGVYSACRHADERFHQAVDISMDTETLRKVLGFSKLDGYLLYFPPLCDEAEAFSLLVQGIPTAVSYPPAEMLKNGASIDYSQRIDADLDGNLDEWFIALDTQNVFLVFPSGSHYRAEELDASFQHNKTRAASIQVVVEPWNNFKSPIMIIQSDQEFDILTMDENHGSQSLFFDLDIMDYTTSNQNTIPQLQLFFMKPKPNAYYPDRPWDGYRWDTNQREFRNDLLEYNLFILRDPEKSVQIVEKLLPLLDEWERIPGVSAGPIPYLYYLSGLSYELAGNPQRAAQIYWKLWHDFPANQYALLAKYKLELGTP